MTNVKFLSPSMRSALLGYALAILSVLIAAAGIYVMETRWQASAPVAMFLLAIIASAWFGGAKPGLLAIALSIVLFGSVYLPLVAAPATEPLQIVRLVSLAGVACYVIWVTATERKAAESLRRAGDELRVAIDTVPAMVWISRPNGALEFLNRRWLAYSGGALPAALEQAEDAIHPDDRARVLEKRRRTIAAAEPYEDEVRLRRADGAYRWFLVRSVPLLDANGKVVKWYGTSAEIEDRKSAEAAVRENEQLLKFVLETLPISVVVVDQAGDILLVNAATRRLWAGEIIVSGAERRAFVRGFWHNSGKQLSPGEWASAAAVSEGREVVNELIDIEAFDGRRKTIENSAAPIRNSDGVIIGAVVVNHDVTDRVRAEEAQRESSRELQQLSRRLLAVQEEERRHLSRELHDEFGQILAAISLHLEAAKSLAGEAARPDLAESARLVRRAGARVRSLALDLRPTMLETAGLNATLRWLAEEHQQRTGVPTRVAGQLSDVSGDLAIAVFRVVQEALTNAARHARAQHVWIEVSETEQAVEIAIRDDGVGFDVKRTQEESGDGSHLGLLGMRERVQILGGRLEVESRPQQGTRIRVSLPLPQAVREAA
jgi:PAS domain S-box-containing protein